MQIHRLFSSVLIAGSLLGTPIVAFAEPTPIAVQSVTTAKPAPTTVTDDAARYAQMEKESPAAGSFQGGGSSIYIGGSVLTVLLVVLLIVIIL